MMASAEGGALLEEKRPPQASPEKKKTKFDVIIIGAGPAGYTAGVYCSRARHDTLIISGILPGGQLVNTTEVENYPGFASGIMGPDLMIEMRKQAEKMGTVIIDGEAVNVDFRQKPFKVLTAEEEYEAKAVIIATGANPRKLGVEGEEALGGRGVSYCATCDAAFFRDKRVIVAGGGDSAMEEATFLTKFASEVVIVHRREELRASKIMQERAQADPKISFRLSCKVTAIHGDPTVDHVDIESGGKAEKEEVGGIFIAIGHTPNTEMFKGQIDLDDAGYIALKAGASTNIKGVFAAGDVHDRRYRQAVTAAGFGCMAALEVDKYLSES